MIFWNGIAPVFGDDIIVGQLLKKTNLLLKNIAVQPNHSPLCGQARESLLVRKNNWRAFGHNESMFELCTKAPVREAKRPAVAIFHI